MTDSLPKISWIKNMENMKIFDKFNNGLTQLLDENYEMVDHIPGLKTTLYPHQKTIVKAMIDLENNQSINVKLNNEVYKIESNIGILSEKVGSGKTFDILATILYNPTPAKNYEIDRIVNAHSSFIYKKSFKTVLHPTLIFVGISVLHQWVNTIKKYTSLTLFVVNGLKEYEQLINKIIDKSVNEFDIILIKNGTIARPIVPAGVKLLKINQVSSPHIYCLLANIKGVCWKRLVIDDFDTINLKHNSITINSNFTWYISSTRKYMKTLSDKTFIESYYGKTSDLLEYTNNTIGNITYNWLLHKHFNLRNDPEFITNTNNLSTPKFFAYRFKNPNKKLINIIGTISEDMKEIIEMINADAIETAAERLGIKTTSTAAIFEKILGNHYNDVINYVKIIKFIDEQIKNKHLRNPYNESHGSYGIRRLEKLEPITIEYPNIDKMLAEQKQIYIEKKSKVMVVLDRIKDHIIEDECPICSLDIKEDCGGCVCIFKCCSIMVCQNCTFSGVFKNKINAPCANCRTNITLKELIYINKEFNLDDLIKDMDNDNIDESKVDENNIIKTPIVTKKEYSKYDAIIDIIRGNSIECKKEVIVDIPVLMTGPAELPEATNKKVLVFANFDETLYKIQDKFIEEKIQYEKLGGTTKQIFEIVNRFQTSNTHNVLLINSLQHCAGLNLQMASDLIFAHLIIDENIEGQVAGRIMRLGRKYAANFHYVMFDNEYDQKRYSGRMMIKNI